MKITKIIQLADMIAPNKLPTEIKVHYLNEVEGVVATEVLMLSTADVPVYTADDIDIEMLVKPPHDKLYLDYLISMIHFANGEYNKYANTFEKYNESLKEYHRFVFNTVCPANGGAVKELYYVSAYAIAVAHGYKGSEDEFGEMLARGGGAGGADGITPHIGANGNWYIGDTDTGVRAEGRDGVDGVGIASVEQTYTATTDGGSNEVTVSLTNGVKQKLYIKNGSKGSPGSGGGADGITPHIGANGNWYIGDTDTGVRAEGRDGVDGDDGVDGVGIKSVTQTTTSTADGGENVVTVTLTNGATSTFRVRNGAKGSPGVNGDDYVLTSADKNEIAELAAGLVDVPGGGGNLTLLWQNASPGSEFAGQTITLSGNTAERLLIQFITPVYDSFVQITYAMCSVSDSSGNGTYWDDYGEYPKSSEYSVTDFNWDNKDIYIRTFAYHQSDKVIFYNSKYYNPSNDYDGERHNYSLIPNRIYAIG